MRIVLWTGDQTVFHRVVVGVIKVPAQVFFIADDVVPEARLPQGKAMGDTMEFLEAQCEAPFNGEHDPRDVGLSGRFED